MLNSVLKYTDIQVEDTEEAVLYMPEYMQDLTGLIQRSEKCDCTIGPKDADRMANRVDPDQIAPNLIWVYTVFPGLFVRKLRIICLTDRVGKPAKQYVEVR